MRDLVTSLDTLILIPGRALFYMVWRATLAIETSDASEVSEVRIEYGSLPDRVMGDEPRRYAGGAIA